MLRVPVKPCIIATLESLQPCAHGSVIHKHVTLGKGHERASELWICTEHLGIKAQPNSVSVALEFHRGTHQSNRAQREGHEWKGHMEKHGPHPIVPLSSSFSFAFFLFSLSRWFGSFIASVDS